jgi:hypothetical protein
MAQVVYQARDVTLWSGDARLALRSTRPKSVMAGICSPPYYGLRSYPVSPTVWGGREDCEHDWCDPVLGNRTIDYVDPSQQRLSRDAKTCVAERKTSRPEHGRFCRHCGAWLGCLGLEHSVDLYVAHLVEIFALVRDVLRDEGTLAVNLGDSYAGGGHGPTGESSLMRKSDRDVYEARQGFVDRRVTGLRWVTAHNEQTRLRESKGLEVGSKNLLEVPSRFALAMIDDGWVLRSRIPWIKRSALPESVDDRPTSAVEYWFLFSKSNRTTFWTHRDLAGSHEEPTPDHRWLDRANPGVEVNEPPEGWESETLPGKTIKRWRRINRWRGHDYFWDAVAVRRQCPRGGINRRYRAGNKARLVDTEGARGRLNDHIGFTFPSEDDGSGRQFRNSDLYFDSLELAIAETRAYLAHLEAIRDGGGLLLDQEGLPLSLEVTPKGLDADHYAAYSCDLIRPLIQAMTPEVGVCAECGAPWVRATKRSFDLDTSRPQAKRAMELAKLHGLTEAHLQAIRSLGTSDAGKNAVTQAGSGRNDDHVKELAAEAKAALGGYFREFLMGPLETTGWRPTCDCGAPTVPATVFDPFVGSGTTAVEARRLGRAAVGVDLSEKYLQTIAIPRIEATTPSLFVDVDEGTSPLAQQPGLL